MVGPYREQTPGVAASGAQEIGLHFICFNADIAHQFEFIQHTWCNYPQFDRLYNDPDPIAGTAAPVGFLQQDETQNFTIQGCPVNRRIPNLERFITIRGGGYFFLPSFRAIRYLASL